MKDFIIQITEMGLANTIYYLFHVLGFIGVFAFVVWYGKKLHISAIKSILIVLIVYPLIYFWMYVVCWIESGFTAFGGNNIVRVFVYVPLVGYPVAKLMKIKWKTICDLLAFCPLMVHGISHFGCIFAGCCAGYPFPIGIYNVDAEKILFPNQPIEALAAVAIIIILLRRAKKNQYVPTAETYPLMLVMFGSSRFLFEFLRDNEKIFLGCSSLAFHALFMFVVGLIALYIIKRKKTSVGAKSN